MFNKKYFSLSNIYQEFYYILRVLDSCETPEQFENTSNWIIQIMNKWEYIFLPISQKEYDKKYIDIMSYLINNINASIENKRLELFPEQPQNIVVKGFR
jgi:hypothetical protein